MDMVGTMAAAGGPAHPVRKVDIEESGRWLVAGWHDLWAVPQASFAFGLLAAAGGLVMVLGLEYAGLGSLILPLAAGFLLIGPLAAVGLYEISRRREAGEAVDLAAAMTAWRRNPAGISAMGLVLAGAMFAWTLIALVIFALFFEGAPPTLGDFLAALYSGSGNLPFLVVGTAAGGVLATAVFAISVVSLPMLLDRDVGVVTAIATSIAVVKANRMLMIGWAATIALLVGMGIATFLVGLVLVLPLLGHASWHAYRSLVA